MQIYIVEKIDTKNEYFVFIGTHEKQFRVNTSGYIVSSTLNVFERKLIKEYFNNLKITVNELRTN